jgi:hypothetical protein
LSNLLREFLGCQSSGGTDLDHAVPAPSKWLLPQQRQRLEEASYNALSSVIARSIAAFDTLAQSASDNCAAKIRHSDRRGLASSASLVSRRHRGESSDMRASGGKPGRAIGSRPRRQMWASAACGAGHGFSWPSA